MSRARSLTLYLAHLLRVSARSIPQAIFPVVTMACSIRFDVYQQACGSGSSQPAVQCRFWGAMLGEVRDGWEVVLSTRSTRERTWMGLAGLPNDRAGGDAQAKASPTQASERIMVCRVG